MSSSGTPVIEGTPCRVCRCIEEAWSACNEQCPFEPKAHSVLPPPPSGALGTECSLCTRTLSASHILYFLYRPGAWDAPSSGIQVIIIVGVTTNDEFSSTLGLGGLSLSERKLIRRWGSLTLLAAILLMLMLMLMLMCWCSWCLLQGCPDRFYEMMIPFCFHRRWRLIPFWTAHQSWECIWSWLHLMKHDWLEHDVFISRFIYVGVALLQCNAALALHALIRCDDCGSSIYACCTN